MKHTYEWFQQQANANRQNVDTWPEWMRSGPAFAAATFPTSAARSKDAQIASKTLQGQGPVTAGRRKR